MLTTFTYVLPVVLQFGLFICLRSGGRGIHPASRRVPAWWGRDQRWSSLWVQTVPRWGWGVVGEGKVGLSPGLQQRGRWGGGRRRVSSHRQRRHYKLQRVAAGRIQWWGETQSFRGTVLIWTISNLLIHTQQKLITGGGNYAHLCGVNCENRTFLFTKLDKKRHFNFFLIFRGFFTNSKLIKTNRCIQKGMFFSA